MQKAFCFLTMSACFFACQRQQASDEVLAQIQAALERIENGTYGRCVVDSEPIEPARLEAVPWAPYCARHQREAEARAGVRTPRA